MHPEISYSSATTTLVSLHCAHCVTLLSLQSVCPENPRSLQDPKSRAACIRETGCTTVNYLNVKQRDLQLYHPEHTTMVEHAINHDHNMQNNLTTPSH